MRILLLLLLTLGFVLPTGAARRKPPYPNWSIHPQYARYLRLPFKHTEFRRLNERDQAAFFAAYPPDKEMQTKAGVTNCIAGEAPPFAAALKQCRIHYPKIGRMAGVTGRLEWSRDEGDDRPVIVFRTAQQTYHVREYFLQHRLEQKGFKPGSKPITATLDAVWEFDQLSGLFLSYAGRLDLAENGAPVAPER